MSPTNCMETPVAVMSVDDQTTRVKETMEQEWSTIVPSEMSQRTINPIRRLMANMKVTPNSSYEPISLSIGDPTIFGNLPPHENVLQAIEESLRSGKNNGYAPSTGQVEAKRAIAEFMAHPDAPLTEKDVYITSACSGAIEICLGALGDPGDNILMPRPGFPLYKVIGRSYDLEVKSYNLLPEKEWEIDLVDLERQIDSKTKCIVVINPSNPCGSVYSKDHLRQIIAVAEKHKLVILADEIYAHCVFPGEEYHPMAALTKTVPILSCNALSKRFLVPGWRLGWVQVHDHNNLLKDVRQGLFDLSTRILGANTIVQGALPRILRDTPKEWFDNNLQFLKDNSDIAFEKLSMVVGLKPIRPRGAMYMMVQIEKELLDKFGNDLVFVEKLMAAKSVFCLPSTCFDVSGFFRIVLTVPTHYLEQACQRMQDFCQQQMMA